MPVIQGIEVSAEYICSISGKIMLDPVSDAEGRCYERESISRWIAEHNTHPTDRTPLKVADLQPAVAVRRLIRILVDANQILIDNNEIYIPANTGDIFIAAIKANDLVTLRYLVKIINGHANAQAWKNVALLTATQQTELEIMRYMHEVGAVLTREELRSHVLRFAAEDFYRCEKKFSRLSEDMRFNVRSDRRQAKDFLILVQLEQARLLSFLIEIGGSMISQDTKDLAFYYASINFNPELLEILYAAGANVNKLQQASYSERNGSLISPLSESVKFFHSIFERRDQMSINSDALQDRSKECVIRLLEMGADPDVLCVDGKENKIMPYERISSNLFIAEAAGARMQTLCALPPKVNDLQQRIEALTATVTQQASRIDAQATQITAQQEQIRKSGDDAIALCERVDVLTTTIAQQAAQISQLLAFMRQSNACRDSTAGGGGSAAPHGTFGERSFGAAPAPSAFCIP